tara:strand:- start:307 stop:639 length:333 start_codon:yes stop_codon:yes gene_type:complete
LFLGACDEYHSPGLVVFNCESRTSSFSTVVDAGSERLVADVPANVMNLVLEVSGEDLKDIDIKVYACAGGDDVYCGAQGECILGYSEDPAPACLHTGQEAKTFTYEVATI